VSRRPLVSVSAITLVDYLLWNWSLKGDHGVLALIAGLTLPPLVLACLWLLTLSIAHLIADAARTPSFTRERIARARRSGRARAAARARMQAAGGVRSSAAAMGASPEASARAAAAAERRERSGKIAA
jgi:hypothetical protein